MAPVEIVVAAYVPVPKPLIKERRDKPLGFNGGLPSFAFMMQPPL
jgi:hypothetical protein